MHISTGPGVTAVCELCLQMWACLKPAAAIVCGCSSRRVPVAAERLLLVLLLMHTFTAAGTPGLKSTAGHDQWCNCNRAINRSF